MTYSAKFQNTQETFDFLKDDENFFSDFYINIEDGHTVSVEFEIEEDCVFAVDCLGGTL